jgi:hypothetical protein
MIRCYPIILPNELFICSVFRFQKQQNISQHRINQNIFDLARYPGSFLWPRNLKLFEDKIRDISFLSAEEIIENNTNLRYFRPVLSERRLAQIVESILYGKYYNQTFKKQTTIEYRFCRACIIEDSFRFNDFYLHREHYLPGMIICHKHKCFLEVQLPKHTTQTRNRFPVLENLIAGISEPVFCDDMMVNKLATEAYQILLGYKSLCFAEIIDACKSLGILKSYTDRDVVSKVFLKDFESYVGNLHPRLKSVYVTDLKLIAKILKGLRISSNPHWVLLIHNFLQHCEHYNTSKTQYPKFPCLNLFCENFKKPVLSDSGSIRKSDKNSPGLYINCPCGTKYIRYFDHNKPDKIMKYGKSLLLNVKEMRRKGQSYEQISKKVNLSKSKLINIACKIIDESPRKKRSIFSEELLIQRRSLWSAELNSPSFLNIRTSMVSLKTVYRWLAKNDNEWLIELNKKFRVKQKPHKKNNEIQFLDGSYAKKLESYINELQEENIKRRISMKLLQETQELKSIIYNRFRLPECRKILETRLETVIDFKIRKAKGLVVSQGLINKKNRKTELYKLVNLKKEKFSEEELKKFDTSIQNFGVLLVK